MTFKALLVYIILYVLAIDNILASTSTNIAKVRLESCPGCSLNRLPEVRKFFYEDVPKYENVEWKKISGAPPEAIFLTENDEEVERQLLGQFNREECNMLLQNRGFKLKQREL